MTLTPGIRFGPYEIVAALGAGGMGEVYKAHDPRLDRVVAIKILPSADPELRARFEREARAIARLQHPHICTVHDVGRENGTDYLVLELLEGETLASRITRGAVPCDEALTYAIQIGEALDAAHRAGIVHRDLKPGNVFLARGASPAAAPVVKLRDFGLAKLRPAEPIRGLATSVTTAAGSLTDRGTLLGTLHYMAPEQLEGHEADTRSDVFAFGCVLYETILNWSGASSR